jgi:tetratricopeptide (TPR) repeat protein
VILYFAFVSNIKTNKQKMNIIYSGLFGTILATILGIFEHYSIFTTCYLMGLKINQTCWIQDVKTRVFSTVGQPNWLAALIVIYIPIVWNLIVKGKQTFTKFIHILIFTILFLGLLFTKSRSGLLAFVVEFVLFWGKEIYSNFKKIFYIFSITFVLSFSIFLSYYPNNLFSFLKTEMVSKDIVDTRNEYQSPVLETGGTESGAIRKYVWYGAIKMFEAYPMFGSGPETFAYIFPKYKSIDHNLTSEWDYIYNKAHNEFLNTLSTTGLFGFISYLFIIYVSILQITNYKDKANRQNVDTNISYSLLVSYVSILVTNFFGFSVVPTSLLFFLIPAFSIDFDKAEDVKNKNLQKKNLITIYSLIPLVISIFLIYKIYIYWKADNYFALAKRYNTTNQLKPVDKYKKAKDNIEKAISYNKNEPSFYAEASQTYSEIALLQENQNKKEVIEENVQLAIDSANKASTMSPKNVNYYKNLSSIYYRFAMFNNQFLQLSIKPLEEVTMITPNDPKVYYQLGILYLKTGEKEKGITALEKSVELKSNYKEGRFALGLTYLDFKNYKKSEENLRFILENIDSNDELTKKYLIEAKTLAEQAINDEKELFIKMVEYLSVNDKMVKKQIKEFVKKYAKTFTLEDISKEDEFYLNKLQEFKK